MSLLEDSLAVLPTWDVRKAVSFKKFYSYSNG